MARGSLTSKPKRIDECLLEEAVPTALEYLSDHGHLLGFAPDRDQRLSLMRFLVTSGLAIWNQVLRKYELTPQGRDSLANYHMKIAAGLRNAS